MYLIVNVMIQNYMYGRVRWPWVSELYEYVQGVFLAKAIVTVVANPRKPTFNVTAKGLTLDEDHLSELAWPFFAIYGLLFVGGLTAALRYAFEPGVNALMLVVCLWNTFNMIIAGVALGAVAERKQPDRHPRLGVRRSGRLEVAGRVHPVQVVDVSAGGCAVLAQHDAELDQLRDGDAAALIVDAVGPLAGAARLPLITRRVQDQQGSVKLAFEFPELKSVEYFALADLMYGDSDALPRFLASRRAHKDIFRGSAQFVRWGLFEPIRSFAYAAAELKARWSKELLPNASSDGPTAALRHEAQALEQDRAHLAAQKPVVSSQTPSAERQAPAAAAHPLVAEAHPLAAERQAPAAQELAATVAHGPVAAPQVEPSRPTTVEPVAERAPQPALVRPRPAAESVNLSVRDPLAELVAALSPEETVRQPPLPAPALEDEQIGEDTPVDNLRRLLDGARRARRSAA
jgi:hypothetical protein